MKVRELHKAFQTMVEEGHGDVMVYAIDGASGVSYEISAYSSSTPEAKDWVDSAPICELPKGTPIITVSLD